MVKARIKIKIKRAAIVYKIGSNAHAQSVLCSSDCSLFD